MTLIIFACLFVGLICGLPIAFTLGGIGAIFLFCLQGPGGLFIVASGLFEKAGSFILVAAPLFVLMANFLEVSDIADDLYSTMYRWTINLPGGLASGTVVICAIFAAMAGISGVATITMGLIAIPSMLKRNYDKRLVVGTVSAGGALGILIPPSVIAVLYGSLASVSVGRLFMGGMIPGILLAVIFIVYITLRCRIQPHLGPPGDETFSWKEKLTSLKYVILPVLLILLVLGTIYFGICTPTEAAGVGAFGSLICLIYYRKFNWDNLRKALLSTFNITSMCIWIIFGAHCFSAAYSMIGAGDFMLSLVSGTGLPPIVYIIIMQLIWFVLGCLLDPIGMLMVTLPVFLPLVISLGYDPIWFGVLFIINCEMAYITPPFGFNLFYMKSIVPKEISLKDIYWSVLPFVGCQALLLILCVIFPKLILWLPDTMFAAIR